MKNRGAYQKRKERQNRIANILLVLVCLLLLVMFAYSLVQNIVNIRDIDRGTLRQFSGSYELSEKITRKSYGHKTYVFSLHNGDVVNISSHLTENDDLLKNNLELTIHYTTMPTTLGGDYSAVSITSADGTVVFTSMERVRRESVGMIWLLSIALLLIFGFLVMTWMVNCYPNFRNKRNKKHRK